MVSSANHLRNRPRNNDHGFWINQGSWQENEVFATQRATPKKYDDHYLKLKLIFERTVELIDTYHPDEIAIEAPFYGKMCSPC